MWLFYVIVGVVFFATFAMCVQQGLWSNTLTVINIVLSGLIAFGYYSPLAKLIADKGGDSYAAVLDFVSMWLLYVIAFVLLQRLGAGLLSKTKMRFKHPIDPVGGPLMAAVAGWLMACLVAATLHAAPFEKECFGGIIAEQRSSTITNPDLAWLSIMQKMLSNSNMGAGGKEFDAGRYWSEFNKQREAVGKQENLRS